MPSFVITITTLLAALTPVAASTENGLSANVTGCDAGSFFEKDKCMRCPDSKWCKAGAGPGQEVVCRKGHEGWGCGKCSRDFFYHDSSGVCRECPVRDVAQAAYISTAFGVTLFCMLM